MSCTSKSDDSSPKISRIYFQFSIGCALAGGVWQDYKETIEDFSRGVNQSVIIAKNKLPTISPGTEAPFSTLVHWY